MIVLNYSPDEEHVIDAAQIPVGGAMCGRGVEGILFDRKDMERITEMLNSDSVCARENIIDYITSLCTRYSCRNPSHKALLK